MPHPPEARRPIVTGVSAFFPCYNDAPTIAGMVEDARTALQRSVDDFEVIVVDDGSPDGSAAVLEALAGDVPELRVVRHERNRGYGGALISGLRGRDQGVDLLHRRRRPVRRLASWTPASTPCSADTDIVQGWKIGRGDPWYRKLIGRAYHHVVRLLFRLHVRDTDCDFRLFRRTLLDRVG